MANPFKALGYPEYLFQPRRFVVRMKRQFVKPRHAIETVRLPWGSPLRIRPHEVIGANIWYYGIFDLIVAEAICRLLEPCELAIDIGANIGQVTSLMRKLVTIGGRVLAFEPHPEVFHDLSENAALSAEGEVSPVELHSMALSDVHGRGSLEVAVAWDSNRGLGKVVAGDGNGAAHRVSVELRTLDSVLEPNARCGVCKIDVEGHELQVLRGARETLSSGRIRDIVFEDLAQFPSRTHELLLGHGYSLFSIHKRLFGPALGSASEEPSFHDGHNYLATLDPNRALRRFRRLGWQVLRT